MFSHETSTKPVAISQCNRS